MRRAPWWRVVRLPHVPEQAGHAGARDDERLDLESALRTLSDAQRLVLALHYYLDLPIDEVAATLGVSKSAAKSRVIRAVRALRPALPVSGQATEIDAATFDPYFSLIRSSPPPTGRGPSLGISGNDPEHAMYTIGGRNPGTPYTIVVIVDGHPTDIYSGVNGDQMDFDPVNVWFDGSRLWFSNYDSKYLWTWTAATGLTHYSVQIPGAPGGYRHSVVYWIAGPCL